MPDWDWIVNLLIQLWLDKGCTPEQAKENAAIELQQMLALAQLQRDYPLTMFAL